MAGFYEEMASMVDEILSLDSDGGLGQPSIKLIRYAMPAVSDDLDDLHIPQEPVETSELLKAASSSAAEFADGTTILASDTRVIARPPVMNWKMESAGELSIDLGGKRMAVIRVRTIPPTGIPVAVEFIAREG